MPDFNFQGIKDAIGSLLGQSTGEDAVSMLIDDHKRVKEIFDTFKDLSDDEKIEAKHKALVELALHAAVEEKLVYPLLREEDEDDEVNEAVVEHHVVKLLIVELEAMKQVDAMLDAKFKVLGEIVQHHVEEEESEMFPKLRSSDNDLHELGAEIKALKEDLLGKVGEAYNLGAIDPELTPHSARNGSSQEEHSNGNGNGRKSAPKSSSTSAARGKAAAGKKAAAGPASGRKGQSASGKSATSSKSSSKSKAALSSTASGRQGRSSKKASDSRKATVGSGAKTAAKKATGLKAKAKTTTVSNKSAGRKASSSKKASVGSKVVSAAAKKKTTTTRKAGTAKKVGRGK